MNKTVKIVIGTVAITLLIVAAFLTTLAKSQKLVNFPFTLEYRKALTGSGYVDRIVNTSGASQPVKITLHNPTLNQTKVYSTVIDAHQFKEIGYLQGWTASSGDNVTLEWNGVAKAFNIP